MANPNVNVSIDRSASAAPQVNVGQGFDQSAQVNWNVPQQSAQVNWSGNQASYDGSYDGGGNQYSGDYAFAEQLASRDLGSMSRMQEQSQTKSQMQEQARQQAARERSERQQSEARQRPSKVATSMSDVVASGQRTQEQQRRQQQSRDVPVIDASVIDEAGVMSSRSPKFDKTEVHENLAESGAEMIAAREASRGSATPYSLAMSKTAAETMNEHQRQRSKAKTTPQHQAPESREEVKQIDPEERPNSIFNRSFGYNRKDRKARTRQASQKRPKSVFKAMQKKAASAFKRQGVGYRVYGKMLGLPSLRFDEVGVGMREIMAAIEQDSSMLNRLFAPFLNDGDNIELWSPSEIAAFVNSNDIYVGTFKEPSNRGQDVQRRKLRVLTRQQRGIYIHPIMAAMYTADFDGDEMEVSLDPKVAELARDPMEHMVGIDGKQSLNTDFLPVSRMIDGYAKGKSARDFVREVMFSSFAQLDVRPLVDAVLKLGDTSDQDDDAQANAWGRVFEAARDVAGSDNDLMSRLCRAVYDTMAMIGRQNALTSIDADIIGMEKIPDPKSYDDSAIYSLMRDMVEGEVPNNFQDLKVMLSGFIGNVSGKNAPFRFTADVGKMMKMDKRLQIGDGTFVVDPENAEQMSLFFESTVKFAESRRMAREIKKAGRSQYYTQKMRENVISEVGFPERYESFQQFLTAFCQSYNRNSALINEANLVFLSNYGIASESNRGLVSPLNPSPGGLTLGDLGEPLLSIYGSYSVGRMFENLSTTGKMGERVDDFFAGNPNAVRRAQKRSVEREFDYVGDARFWITGKYMNRSLRAFAHENNLIRGNMGIEDIRSRKVSDLGRMSDTEAEFEMLIAIADKKTGVASKFNEIVYGIEKKKKGSLKYKHIDHENTTVKRMSELLMELDRLDTDGTVSGRRDQMLWVNDVVEALIMSGPDMFNYFNMDSTAGFLQSKWARKMVEHANDPEVLGGIRTAMMFDYRMERVTSLQSEIPDPNDDVDRYMDAYNNLEFAKDELAASSEVWHGIIAELMAEETEGQESVFQMMRSGRLFQEGPNGRYEWDIKKDARAFWANPGEHTTLRSVIEDLDMDRQTKWNVIADVVRYWEHDAYLKSYEVGYQLEIGSDAAYSLTSSGQQSALGVAREFEQAFNRWGKKSQERLQQEVNDAFDKHGNTQGRLMHTLQRLDSSPWELVAIDDMMYADSILSVKDKTYAQTEKASQHPWTNAIYAALSFQRNGGYMHDITRTDDRLLGLTSIDAVDISDVVHILADGDAEMWVYNQYGEVGQVTREILLQNALGRELSQDIEQDIWEFLKQEPRIASAIRCHNACVMADTDGTGYLGSALSLSETIERSNGSGTNPIDHVRYLMRDHPVYAGIISMASPSLGAVTRNERQRVAAIERYLSYQIYQHASTDMSAEGAAAAILADLGITRQSLLKATQSNYDLFLELIGLPVSSNSNEAAEDAMTTYNTVLEHMTRYIREVKDNVQTGVVIASVEKPSGMGVDVSSAASFWDVVQELGGAKTSVSTGIEGSETYQFGEWASHISARDKFADLEAVFDDVDQSWNGMWTNLVNPDGSPILLEVDESGEITNYREIMEAKKSQEYNEVVVSVPTGYDVQDRSTVSMGDPVPSLFAYMVSKRSNGAEAFNLKAKKAGLDGKDSITKMQGKYCTTTYQDENGRTVTKRVSYTEVQEQLRRAAQQNSENGLMAAKVELAKMMLRENEELGYDDLTLANYMCIADLMLMESTDENGNKMIHLRSLEMLFSAIKHRIGSSVDEMTDQEIIDAANGIVEDSTEDGVGIAEMSGSEAFDSLQPKSKASSFNGIRQNSSVFERNYNLLEAIRNDASMNGFEPMSPRKAESINERIVGHKGIQDIKDIMRRCSVTRNYSVVGYSAVDGRDRDINWTIGPSHMIVIGDGQISDNEMAEICEMSYGLGMTVLVSAANRSKIPSVFVKDAMPCSDVGDVIIPCFDMRLNGAESTPYNGGRFSIFQAPFSRYVVSVEDSINEYELGDAEVKPTKALVDRIKVIDNGSTRIDAENLFPNVFRNPDFKHCLFSVSLASGDEIRTHIADGVKCTIDYGIVEGGNGFDQRKNDVDAAIERYQGRWSEANADGIIMGGMTECAPGDIVAWAEVEIRDQFTDETQYVLAPIIPFPLHGSTKNIPERFTVEQVGTVDSDNTLFAVDWSNTSDISNGFAKYFDSSGGANKGMIDFTEAIGANLVLRDGTPVDAYVAKASTDSRKIGTDRRIKTMISLMALARMHGYNFAKSEGAFPSDPNHPENDEIRECLLHKRIPTSEWHALLNQPGGMLFSNDFKLNAFLNYECAKIMFDGGNPSDYLANVYTDANGVERNTHVMWEFEAMFDQGLNYEDSLLRFLHAMDPTLCPSGLDDSGEYMFRLAREGKELAKGYDSGVLQMQVPHRLSNSHMSYLWDNVYIGMSFFGEDYSGFSRPNIDGASNFLDAMNTMSYYGAQLDESSARFRAMWATSDIGRVPHDGGAYGKR